MLDKNIQLTSNIILSPEKTMEIVLEIIEEIIPYELAVILSKESEDRLKVRYAHGLLANEKLRNYEVKLNNHPEIREVLKSGKVKLVEETKNKDHHDTYEEIIELPVGHSCLLAPLSYNNETFGLMTLDHRQCDIFTQQRVSLTNSFIKLISLALAQSMTSDRLKNENELLMFERNSLLDEISTIKEGLVGNSYEWKQILEKIKLVAPTDSNVMILGETGTGKEQVAKAIHSLSTRKDKPFITLNCSALNYNLVESELFGHEKGSFTGAISSRRGRFELANGGTLFLDEIGDLSIDIQPKLLRAIQEGTFERIGSEKTYYSDVRIICATNIELEQKIKEGKFREDLYYRLNVFPITIPPLRKRKEDIVTLAHYFINKLSEKFKNKNLVLTKEAISFLLNHSWPGNVRELQNTLERAAILSIDGTIKINHLKSMTIEKLDSNCDESKITSFDDEIRNVILKALKITNGKIYGKNGAAELLKLKPTTLQSKIKKYNIKY